MPHLPTNPKLKEPRSTTASSSLAFWNRLRGFDAYEHQHDAYEHQHEARLMQPIFPMANCLPVAKIMMEGCSFVCLGLLDVSAGLGYNLVTSHKTCCFMRFCTTIERFHMLRRCCSTCPRVDVHRQSIVCIFVYFDCPAIKSLNVNKRKFITSHSQGEASRFSRGIMLLFSFHHGGPLSGPFSSSSSSLSLSLSSVIRHLSVFCFFFFSFALHDRLKINGTRAVWLSKLR